MLRGMSCRALLSWIGMYAIRSMGFGRQWIAASPLQVHSTSQRFCGKAESIDDLLDKITSNDPAIGVPNVADVKHDSAGWTTITWPSRDDMGVDSSPMKAVLTKDRLISVKRDDLLRLPGSQLSGNKARKMLSLQNLDSSEFPADCVVSYGGPQSNAMLAIAATIRYHNDQRSFDATTIRFVYYTKKLPKYLQKQTTGNLFRSLSLGMELVQVSPVEYENLFGGSWGGCETPPAALEPPASSSLWIPQGGACRMAVAGVDSLAQELLDEMDSSTPTTIVIPGGTCTTAVLLQRALRNEEHVEVAVIPCVGDALYAERQMIQLLRQLGEDDSVLPRILPADPLQPNLRYLPFGEPHRDTLETYRQMQDDVELDLLYGAPSWTILQRNLQGSSPLDGRRVIYVHTGGLEGVHTQLLRYKYKGLLLMDDTMLQSKRVL